MTIKKLANIVKCHSAWQSDKRWCSIKGCIKPTHYSWPNVFTSHVSVYINQGVHPPLAISIHNGSCNVEEIDNAKRCLCRQPPPQGSGKIGNLGHFRDEVPNCCRDGYASQGTSCDYDGSASCTVSLILAKTVGYIGGGNIFLAVQTQSRWKFRWS